MSKQILNNIWSSGFLKNIFFCQGKESCVLLILEKLTDGALINSTNTALQTWVEFNLTGIVDTVEHVVTDAYKPTRRKGTKATSWNRYRGNHQLPHSPDLGAAYRSLAWLCILFQMVVVFTALFNNQIWWTGSRIVSNWTLSLQPRSPGSSERSEASGSGAAVQRGQCSESGWER